MEFREGHREVVLRWTILAFMGLGILVLAFLPPVVAGGYSLMDPTVLAAVVGYPVFAWILLRLLPRDFRAASQAFVATSMVMAWVFTIAIQGTGYLVGNYAYLSVIVMFAAFFLDARATAVYAALNIGGVIVVHAIWGLTFTDLVLSLSYLTIFSTMLVVIAGMMQKRSEELAQRTRDLERSNQELEAAHSEQELILENTDDAIVHISADGIIQHINRRAQGLARTMWRAVPNAGEEFLALVPLEHRQTAERWRTSGKRRRLETKGRHFDVRFVTLPDRSQIAVATEVTNEVLRAAVEAAQEKKLNHMAQLEAINRLQRDFMKVASNELQTPLTPMRLQIHVIRDRGTGSLNATQIRSLDVMERNILRMSDMVEEIRDIVRIQNDELAVEVGDIEVVEMTQAEIDAIAATARLKEVVVLYDGPSSVWARGDAKRLKKVIGQLLENAIKFSDAGGVVQVRIRQSDEMLWEIEDDGAGFDPKDHARVFEPFTQLHDSSDIYGGSGLGLTVSRGYIEAQGGRLEAETKGLGNGAVFRFALPLVPSLQLER